MGVLPMRYFTIYSVVNVCPEGGNEIPAAIGWDGQRTVTGPRTVKGEVSIVIHLQRDVESFLSFCFCSLPSYSKIMFSFRT